MFGSEDRTIITPRDLKIAAGLFFLGACAGMVYVSTWGQTPSFCQDIFGPAAMFACGRGYVNPDLSECPELDTFLHPEMHTFAPPAVDAFSCDDLPPNIHCLPFSALQQRELYLLVSAAVTWWVFGVAWSSLTPLYGILYGAAASAAYGIFRLGMNRALALLCAVLFVASPIQLQNLVRLRDYSKAPFMLAAILIMGLLVRKPLKWHTFLGCAAACGAVIGLGLGFRFDVLICIGAFIPIMLFFVPGKVWERLYIKIPAILLFLAAFLGASWPVITKLPAHGDKCHPALMGLAQLYDDRLGIDADYQLVHRFLDTEPMGVILAHASGSGEYDGPVKIETPEYERMGDAFYLVVLRTFPADLVVRAYAAVLRIIDELRAGLDHAVPRGITNRFLTSLFWLRALVIETVFSHSRYAALLALVSLAAYNLRTALAALFLLLFFGGYTCNQFASRNYFHLEFFALWAGGFLLMQVFDLATAGVTIWGREQLQGAVADRDLWRRSLLRVVCFVTVAAVGLTALLWSLRWYQSNQVRKVLEAYATAELEPLSLTYTPTEGDSVLITSPDMVGMGPVPPGEPYFRYEFLVGEFDTGARDLPVSARYEADVWDDDLTWDTRLAQTPSTLPNGDTTTRLFFPVYYLAGTVHDTARTAFQGLQMPASDAPYLKALYRVRNPKQYPILLTATLPPDWTARPRYQRFVR